MSAALVTGLIAVTALVVFGAVLALVLLALRKREKDMLQKRIVPEVKASEDGTAGGDRALLQKLARRGKAIEGWVDTENESSRLMMQAGWRSNEARMFWYIFQGALPFLIAAILFVFWLLGPAKIRETLFLVLLIFAGCALSFLVPRWILRAAAERRCHRIKLEVPLFIHLLVLLFEAGLSSRQAFASLIREGRGVLPELGREFELVLRQLEAGADTGEVLKNLGDAMAVGDLTTVLGVLRQVDRYGGEVREPLIETLKILEERRGLDLREQVNILSGRMTVVMVLFFFPALLIFVAGPAFVSILKVLGNGN